MIETKKLNIKEYNPKVGGLEKRTYSNEKAVETAIKYFAGNELSAKKWIDKYALKDSSGNLYESSPKDMHERLASEFSRIENKYPNPLGEKEIYNLIKDFKYIVPAGSPMAGIGNDFQKISLSNCFVIGSKKPADSYGGIMKIDEEQVQLMKRRGGVGHDLSHIRPKNSPVDNSAVTSTGVVPFMERYSNSTREVAQDGRRGALMLSISVKHPDAEDFIDAKLEQGKVTGANISIKIDNEFMKAVENGTMYKQQYPIDSKTPEFTKEINAKEMWDKIIHNAWKSAEPGILFWDTIIQESVPDCYADKGYKTVSTNPCGEIPLCPYDSCRLLAINLYSYVEKPFTKEANFNFNLFKKHVPYAQRISDDTIDLEMEKIDKILNKIENDPEEEDVKSREKNLWKNIMHTAKEVRRTGVGITGEGDMLAALNLRYGSEDAIDLAVEVHKTLAVEAYRSSVNLAKDRGAFEIYDSEKEKDNPFIQRLKKEDETLYKEMIKHGRRNIALLTIAPTGTTSIMTQTTAGIEPLFSPAHERRVKINSNDKYAKVDEIDENGDAWEIFNVFHPKFKTWLEINGYDVEKVKKYDEKKMKEVVNKSPYYKSTANDVNWVSKVKMQGAIQKWVDHSISATTNLPEETTEETASKIYLAAWKSGCKGHTIYREGSRKGIMINKKNDLESIAKFPDKRPKEVDAEILRFKNNNKNGGEDWIAFIGLIENKPYEIFTGKLDGEDFIVPKYIKKGKIVKEKNPKVNNGKSYYNFNYINKNGFPASSPGISQEFNREFWNYSKILSGMLRKGMPVADAVDIFSKLKFENANINSWINGVGRALGKYVPKGTISSELCPICLEEGVEEPLIYQEGCRTCSKGHEKCGF